MPESEGFKEYTSLFRFDDEVFIVVGASGGIGAASARALSHLGARVICVSRDLERATPIAIEVDGAPFVADVTREEDVERMIQFAKTEFGQINGLVNVVGGGRFLSISELTADEWDKQFSSNLRQAFFVGKHAALSLAENGGGSLVFVSSISASFGSRAYPAYAAAKSGLESLVKSLAEEFGPFGVRANSVAPAATLTERLQRAWSAEALQDMATPTVIGRLGLVQEIAATIAFLASPASGFITGQTILADGGASIRDPFFGGGKNRGETDIRRDQEKRTSSGLKLF